jgi:hypothetical protein
MMLRCSIARGKRRGRSLWRSGRGWCFALHSRGPARAPGHRLRAHDLALAPREVLGGRDAHLALDLPARGRTRWRGAAAALRVGVHGHAHGAPEGPTQARQRAGGPHGARVRQRAGGRLLRESVPVQLAAGGLDLRRRDVENVLKEVLKRQGRPATDGGRPGQPEAGRRVIVCAALDPARDHGAEAHLGHAPLGEQDLDEQLLADTKRRRAGHEGADRADVDGVALDHLLRPGQSHRHAEGPLANDRGLSVAAAHLVIRPAVRLRPSDHGCALRHCNIPRSRKHPHRTQRLW